jgi:hypothetical protein
MGTSRQVRRRGRWSLIIAVLVAALAVSATASATVWTDKPDYSPGEVVTISGDNSNDAGYLAGETVHVDVTGPNGYSSSCEGKVADDGDTDPENDTGAWSCTVTLVDGPEAVGEYEYTATGGESGVTETGTFRDGGFFLRAVIPGVTLIAATFETDAADGIPSSIDGYANGTCTAPRDKWYPGNLTTLTTGFINVTSGFGTINGRSTKLTAPSPVTVGSDTYVFDSWSVVNSSGGTTGLNGTVSPVAGEPTAGCFAGWTDTAPTYVQANYVLEGDPDLTATKTNDASTGANPGDAFTWTIRVKNEGDADATFADTQRILLDDLPSGPTYGTPNVTATAGVTGTVSCDITSDVLTCIADGGTVTIPPGDYVDISFDVTPGLLQLGALDNPAVGGTCAADPDNVVAEDNEGDTAETNNDCSDTAAVVGAAVTRGGCTFDLDTDTDYETFRNVFTPDMNTSDYKLFSTNPGQFFLNVATYIDGGETVNVTLPFPFVTQGAVPVKVYGDWTASEDNGKFCFDPSNELWSQTDQVVIGASGPYNNFGQTATIPIEPPEDFTGWVWIRIHIDYGLKGLITGCTKSYENADNCTFAYDSYTNDYFDIPDGQLYEFGFSDGLSGGTTIESRNAFKRINGVAGAAVALGGDPIAGTTVQIWQGTKLWKTVTTDDDGWYMALFKYTGKATTFTVKWINLGVQQSIVLKSNGFALVNYVEGVTDASIIIDTSTPTTTTTTPTTSGGNGRGRR